MDKFGSSVTIFNIETIWAKRL